ncbi:MAG: 16S rRNA processing protein RimM [bacterium]|nr:16S rRNA processing protein RimM [bacterium]
MSPSSSSPDTTVCLGVLMGPHGIQGAVKIKSFASPAQGIATYGPLLDPEGGRTFEIEALSGDKGDGTFIARLKGISTREQSEVLRGIELFVERSRLPEIEDEDSFYYSDLEGLSALDLESRVKIGTVRRVANHGGGEFLEIVCEDGSYLTVPFTKEAVPEIKVSEGVLLCDGAMVLKAEPPKKPKKANAAKEKKA